MDLLFRKTNEAVNCTALCWGDCTGIGAPAFPEPPSHQKLQFAGQEMGPEGRNISLHATAEFPQKRDWVSQL